MSKIAKGLLAVQTALETPKAQRNEFGGFNYRSAEDILSALKPHLLEQKLLLTINDELVQKDTRFYIKSTASLCHVDEVENPIKITAFAREPEHKTKADDAMVTGASSSYAMKYALGRMFLCDDTPDPDKTHKFGKDKKPPTKGQPKQQGVGDMPDFKPPEDIVNGMVAAAERVETEAGLNALYKDNQSDIDSLPEGQKADLLAFFGERKAEILSKGAK